jgi:hypothetical protein
VLEDWLRQRHDPRTRLKELVAAWPEISEDLALLPRLLHQAIRRADMRDAAANRAVLVPVVPPREPRTERAIAGAALLIAGVLWSALAAPHWPGWTAAAIGLVVLFVRR